MKLNTKYLFVLYFFFCNALAYTQTTEYQVTTEESQAYIGHYEFSELRILKVSSRDGKFYGQLTGTSELELTPSGPAEFYFTDINAKVEFHGDENNIRSLTMYRTKEEKASKLDISNPKLKKKYASKFVGNYKITEGNFVEIFYADKQLNGKLDGKEFSLIPLREGLFYIPEKIMKIEFNKNFDSTIASLTLFTNNKIEVPKI